MSVDDKDGLELDDIEGLELGDGTEAPQTADTSNDMELDVGGDSLNLSDSSGDESLVAQVDAPGELNLDATVSSVSITDAQELLDDDLLFGADESAASEVPEAPVPGSSSDAGVTLVTSVDISAEDLEAVEEDLSLGEDDGLSLDDELSLGDDLSLDDSLELPNELEAVDDIDLDGLSLEEGGQDEDLDLSLGDESGMSEDAMKKLAEIDEMMEQGPSVASSIDTTQTSTTTEVSGADTAAPSASPVVEPTSVAPTADSTSPPPSSAAASEVSMNRSYIADHQKVSEHTQMELMRLGETIKALREDREQLQQKIVELEGQVRASSKGDLDLKAELDEKKIEISILKKRHEQKLEDIKVRNELLEQKLLISEQQNKNLSEELEKVGRQVRVDINKVRTTERELESKLEMLRSDADIQLRNRDQKILELKRRIDTLEFDLETIQGQGKKVTIGKQALEDKMEKVAENLRSTLKELEDQNLPERPVGDIKKVMDM